MMREAHDQFRAAIRDRLGVDPGPVTLDGRLRRFATKPNGKDKAGWCVGYGDGVPAGAFGDWRSGIHETWCARDVATLTTAEREAHRRQIAELTRQREEVRQRVERKAAGRAERIWGEAEPASPEHPYLKEKGVEPFGVRQHGGDLLVPIRIGGKLSSLQSIAAEGGKQFLFGGAVAGGYHSFGKPAGQVIVCEGYATGATLHTVTGHAVAIAFNAGNLEAVAKAIRAKLPDAKIIIGADDDHETDGNPGLAQATKAAAKVGGMVAVPPFDRAAGEAKTDWNDLAALHGLDAVRKRFAELVAASHHPAPAKGLDPAPHAQGPDKGLRHAYLGDVETMPAKKPWMIKGVLAKGETSAWIAPPKGGKSTLVVDLAIAVASGRDWRGYQNNGASGVLYCALERAADVKRMMVAQLQRGNHGVLPIAIADEIINMMDPGCVELVVTTIRQASDNLRCPIGLLVLDTFAKGIAAGSGDEDKARDQGKVFANLQRIKEQTGVHCLIIGHTGKDAERGARGSNALLGDVDMMVEISGNDIRRATVTGANDRDTGLVTAFRIERFVLGHDEDGDEITTRIIDPELISEDELSTAGPSGKAERPLPRHLEAFREAWRDSCDSSVTGPGTTCRFMGDGPKVECINLSVVRDNFRKRFVTGEADPAKAGQNERQAFRRALARLGAIRLAFGSWDGHEWVWSLDRCDSRDSTVTPLVTPSVTHPVTARASRDRRDNNPTPLKGGGFCHTSHGHGDGSDKRGDDDADRS